MSPVAGSLVAFISVVAAACVGFLVETAIARRAARSRRR